VSVDLEVPFGTGAAIYLKPTKRNFMTSEISSRAACLAELISNPKSFFNCPDLHGGSGSPEDWRWKIGAEGKKQTAQAARLKINRRRRAAVF
jgi:hypothetical protein